MDWKNAEDAGRDSYDIGKNNGRGVRCSGGLLAAGSHGPDGTCWPSSMLMEVEDTIAIEAGLPTHWAT
jgi:hypothetical protein